MELEGFKFNHGVTLRNSQRTFRFGMGDDLELLVFILNDTKMMLSMVLG